MPHLRLALAAGGLLLAVPALSSCGFDYPTERVNTVGAGISARDGQVDALGMLVISGERGSGNLIGTLSNNQQDTDDALVAVIVAGDAEVTAEEFEPVELAPGGFVNLATLVEEGEPIALTGDFAAGDVITATLEFENSEPLTMDIPVDKPCYEYEGLAPEGSTPDPEGTALYECTPSEAPAEEH
jgi:hypothetical protein